TAVHKQTAFVLPLLSALPRLGGSIPSSQELFCPSRCVDMAKSKKILAIVILFIMGPAFIWWGVRELNNSRKLKDHGKPTIGIASEKSYQRRKFGTDYWITAQFKTEA